MANRLPYGLGMIFDLGRGNQNWQLNGENNDPHGTEFYPDGYYEPGYVRRQVPSEMWVDRMVAPPRQNREMGYLPGATEAELSAMEAENRHEMRKMKIDIGNITGISGPPDRVRRS